MGPVKEPTTAGEAWAVLDQALGIPRAIDPATWHQSESSRAAFAAAVSSARAQMTWDEAAHGAPAIEAYGETHALIAAMEKRLTTNPLGDEEVARLVSRIEAAMARACRHFPAWLWDELLPVN